MPAPDYQALFESVPGLYLVLNPDAAFTIVTVSNAYLSATMTRREDMIGRGIFEVFPDNPNDPQASGVRNLRASLERVRTAHVADVMPVQKYDIRRPDSEGGGFEERFWSPLNSPVLSPEGELVYIIHRVEDVTEFVRLKQSGQQQTQAAQELRLRAEQMEAEVFQRARQLAEANEQLRTAHDELARLYAKSKEIDELKTQFFANVSHELRTPLTLILGPVRNRLKAAACTPAERRDLEVVDRNARLLLRHVNDLLDIAKLDAGKLAMHYRAVDLAEQVRLVASHFEVLAEEHRIRFSTHIPQSVTAEVDAEKIQRALFNLLSNAFKFTPQEGSIDLTLHTDAGRAQISVADNGPGVPAEMREAVFERFTQVDGRATRRFGGTGLGLAIVKEFIQLHGGTVAVDTAPAGGARFRLEFPLIAATGQHVEATARAANEEPDLLVTSAFAAPAWKSRHTEPHSLNETPVEHPDASTASVQEGLPLILVVEDNPDMNAFVAQTLRRHYRVASAYDGAQGLQLAMRLRPDLIVTDVMMPEVGGEQLLRQLRTRNELEHVPVVFLTARADEALKVRLLEEGAQEFLEKPFVPEELLARVGRLIAEQRWHHASLREAYSLLSEQVGRLDLLNRVARAMAERQDLQSICQVVVRTLEDSLTVDFACICLRDAVNQSFTVTSIGAKDLALATKLAVIEQAGVSTDENGLARAVAGALVYEPDIRETSVPFSRTLAEAGLAALVIAPLRADASTVGLLIVARRRPESFSPEEREFLHHLSEHVALAAHQAGLYRDLQQAYEELRRSQQALLQQERLRALGQMASGIAHDINNAITPALLYTGSLLRQQAGLTDTARECLVSIQQAIDGVARTVARLQEFYRQRDRGGTSTRIDLNALVRQVTVLTRVRWSDMPQERGQVIELALALAPDPPIVFGAEQEIRDALTNLIFNAVDAMPQGGRLTIRTQAADRVVLEVTDTGIGMDAETRRRCLEPFFTTKGGRGTGLGLAMVYGMAQRHSAELELASEVGQGTTVRLSFPIPSAPAESTIARADAQEPQRALRLLIVDDDPLVIESLRSILSQDGHSITCADGGQAAIDAFTSAHERREPFDIVITDLGMPYVDGRRVAAAVKSVASQTVVIMLTGWGQRMLAEHESPPCVDRVLSKPPKLNELRAVLAELAPVQTTSTS